ncbi:flagellar basal body-associated FliL family protein [Xinfangfangia sp. CPCC 101601]|uniref:Flagellar protein FliL n=1 Tax=Pseudogemmobacter lacusdianii TaxID=3069608 RepID=A0ABU0VU87_9RHOB|nr:flagellar basal body-associated FliL family protein [Xinfangfangia sp. CPCC 101601]MDQ2065294.1 flagellar basal body-associated FliL family protein [Xinfangfangia sp. CPCC 101601]
MMRKLLPLILALIGLAGGIGAGLALRPVPDPVTSDEAEGLSGAAPQSTVPPDYVKLNNQFIVPVVEGGRVASMVVLSLSLEVAAGQSEAIYAREPKLRDAFLQVMFDHANTGGFRGSFTDGSNLVLLRQALREKASQIIGPTVTDVLITDIARQDS